MLCRDGGVERSAMMLNSDDGEAAGPGVLSRLLLEALSLNVVIAIVLSMAGG